MPTPRLAPNAPWLLQPRGAFMGLGRFPQQCHALRERCRRRRIPLQHVAELAVQPGCLRHIGRRHLRHGFPDQPGARLAVRLRESAAAKRLSKRLREAEGLGT